MGSFGFQWHLTDRCNLRCAHCYQDDFSPASERPVAELKEMADRVLGALAGHEVSVNLTGGEPFAWPGLEELVAHLHGFDNLTEINLITNGTRVSERTVEWLAGCAKISAIKISLESGNASINDRIRGVGNLEKATGNIKRLWADTGKDLVLMMTLGRHNSREIRSAIDLAVTHGLSGLIFERFVPLGTGAGMAREVLDPAEWTGVCGDIGRAAGLDVDPIDLATFRAFWLRLGSDVEEPLIGARCNLGAGSMALMPDGTVFPCRRLPVAVGNVLEEPFAEIRERLGEFEPGKNSACRALQTALGDDGRGNESRGHR